MQKMQLGFVREASSVRPLSSRYLGDRLAFGDWVITRMHFVLHCHFVIV